MMLLLALRKPEPLLRLLLQVRLRPELLVFS